MMNATQDKRRAVPEPTPGVVIPRTWAEEIEGEGLGKRSRLKMCRNSERMGTPRDLDWGSAEDRDGDDG